MTELTFKEEPLPSGKGDLFRIALWLLVMILLPSMIIGFCMGIYYSLVAAANNELAEFDVAAWFEQAPVILAMMLGGSIFSLPLLLPATPGKGLRNALTFCRITTLERHKVITTLAIAFVFFATVNLIDYLIPLPKEPFMLQMQQGITSASDIALMVLTVCLIAPVVEELIYRGWLFGRLEATRKCGKYGALIISTLVFILIHSQYQTWVGYGAVAIMGLIFGLLRMRYNSTSYAIIAHIALNSMSTISMLLTR
ncbi:CPBP family intramembrane metalloprotease [Neiella marina]|uniref:CPBP family intramembrane metalloprotease n=1 Tax=Neiella holothuriorum TaxID=2870530 RepID=A0ABS7EDJ9_9GAMM|nr:CPBP family intramembrane glutamic endopeptidase [Neiella holothuriorum]MBW8190419.1 CPBP family intramembrane metalloprotease [Neiella holothuriorum]